MPSFAAIEVPWYVPFIWAWALLLCVIALCFTVLRYQAEEIALSKWMVEHSPNSQKSASTDKGASGKSAKLEPTHARSTDAASAEKGTHDAGIAGQACTDERQADSRRTDDGPTCARTSDRFQ